MSELVHITKLNHSPAVIQRHVCRIIALPHYFDVMIVAVIILCFARQIAPRLAFRIQRVHVGLINGRIIVHVCERDRILFSREFTKEELLRGNSKQFFGLISMPF